VSVATDQFRLKDLERAGDQRFRGRSPEALAGRCLLDAVEYLRSGRRLPGKFMPLVTAHAMRVLLYCLTTIARKDLKRRLEPHVEATCKELLKSRKNETLPPYGDDFWDWAYTIEALHVVQKDYPDVCDLQAVLPPEVQLYFKTVVGKLNSGLTFGGHHEWFGPATAAAAYRILDLCRPWLSSPTNLPSTLESLKQQALERIHGGQYLGKKVKPSYYHWHYGQVVAQFPTDSKWQQEQLKDLNPVKELDDRAARAYALARTIQGTFKSNDEATRNAAVEMVYDCEEKDRPLGAGIVGDEVKGSLNVLEALWPMLSQQELSEVRIMLDRLCEKLGWGSSPSTRRRGTSFGRKSWIGLALFLLPFLLEAIKRLLEHAALAWIVEKLGLAALLVIVWNHLIQTFMALGVIFCVYVAADFIRERNRSGAI